MKFSIRLLILITMLVAVSIVKYKDFLRRRHEAAEIALIDQLSRDIQRRVGQQIRKVEVGSAIVTLPAQRQDEVSATALVRACDEIGFRRKLKAHSTIVEDGCSRIPINNQVVGLGLLNQVELALMSEFQERGIVEALGVELKIHFHVSKPATSTR